MSHQFLRKTFLSLAFCECCRRLLFSGFYCNQCNIRFHPRCANKVGEFCQQINIDSINPHSTDESKAGLLYSGSGLGYHHQQNVHSSNQTGRRPPRSLNQQDRSNSAPNVCINNVKSLTLEQQRTLAQSSRGSGVGGSQIQRDLIFQAQNNQEHSHSTQASPTNTLKHPKRQRARSADESNKNLLSPRDQKSTDENWVCPNRTSFFIYLLNFFFFFCRIFKQKKF